MARARSTTLTEAEQRLMEILWRIGSGTTRDVLAELPEEERRAYSTIRTTLRILADKGYLEHRQEGKAFVYTPTIGRPEAQRSALKQLIRRFFDDSPELLVLNVLENEALEPAEIERLKRAVEAAPTEAER